MDFYQAATFVLSIVVKHAGMHYRTAQQYIDVIIEIQNRPRLEKIESARTVLVRLGKSEG